MTSPQLLSVVTEEISEAELRCAASWSGRGGGGLISLDEGAVRVALFAQCAK